MLAGVLIPYSISCKLRDRARSAGLLEVGCEFFRRNQPQRPLGGGPSAGLDFTVASGKENGKPC